MDTTTPNQEQKQKMFKLVEACHKSGLSNKEWCKQNQIAEHIFYYWQANYRKENRPTESFLPISTGQAPKPGIKIVYPNGVQLELNENTSPSLIATLINLA